MKRCKACGQIFESGNYCGKCGSAVEEILVEDPLKKSVPETNIQIKKTKKQFGKGKMIILTVILVLLGIAGFSAYYLNDSQIYINRSFKFDEEAFKYALVNEGFDGETFDFKLSEVGINYYIEERIKKMEMPSLPFGTEVTGAFYMDGKMVVQLDGAFIHTTLVTSLEVTVSDGKLLVKPKNLKLGKWSIPAPKWILGQSLDFSIEIELPQFLILNDFELKDEMEFDIDLDTVYFDTLIKNAFELIDVEKLQYLQRANPFYKKLYDALELSLNGDSNMLKTVRRDIIRDKVYFAFILAVLEPDETDKILEKLKVDSIYLDEDAFEDILKQRDLIVDEVYAVLEAYSFQRITSAGLSLIEGFYKFLDDRGVSEENLVSYEGKPFSPSLSQFIYAKDLIEVVGDVGSSAYSYDLFYDNDYLAVGIQTDGLYYLADQYGEISPLAKEEAYRKFNYKPTSILAQGVLLPRGDPDRATIAEVISADRLSDASIYIRYLKSDSEWAFLTYSPGDYPQVIFQSILYKKNNIWTIAARFGKGYTLEDSVGRDLLSKGFNVSVLPMFDVTDYYTWYLRENEINQVQSYLVNKGFVSSGEKISYISRVDNVMAVLAGAKKFIVFYDSNSASNYKEIVAIKEGESYSTYLYKLSSDYNGAKPTFVFIQD